MDSATEVWAHRPRCGFTNLCGGVGGASEGQTRLLPPTQVDAALAQLRLVSSWQERQVIRQRTGTTYSVTYSDGCDRFSIMFWSCSVIFDYFRLFLFIFCHYCSPNSVLFPAGNSTTSPEPHFWSFSSCFFFRFCVCTYTSPEFHRDSETENNNKSTFPHLEI
jgi:hypothetical protein